MDKHLPTLTTAPTSEPCRTCKQCSRTLPASRFRIQCRRGEKQYRSKQCDDCHRRTERARYAQKREQSNRQQLFQTWSLISKHKQKRLAIESLVGRLWDQFGGAPGVASSWMKAYREATAARQLRAAESLVALLEWMENHSCDCTGLSNLTDDQLAEEAINAQAMAMSDLLKANPEKALQTATKCGFSLTPLQESFGKGYADTGNPAD